MPRPSLCLGLDASTQSISAVVIDAVTHAVVWDTSLRFDETFPAYCTENGVVRDPADPNVVNVPSLMLVDALDRILEEITSQTHLFQVQDIACISGSAQQHTSAFWARGFSLQECMDATNESTRLPQLLRDANAFAYECGPSWMDSSTMVQCIELENRVHGGPEAVARISGSRAYARFTGNHIAKRLIDDPSFSSRTGRIALASSLLTSLLVGDYTPIDASDACGMNLLDIRTQQWSQELLQATVDDRTMTVDQLKAMLGERVVSPHSTIGMIHPYFQRRYGFLASCSIVPFSGDNPCTLAGIGLAKPGDVAVSLGTSTTLLAVVDPLDTASAKEEGHYFINPVDPSTLMAMVCFKNGALARQDVRDRVAHASWATFESLLQATKPGNTGIVGFFMRDPEITPPTNRAGTLFFNASDTLLPSDALSSLDDATIVRAIVESQCLALRHHCTNLGIRVVDRLIVTGGGAASDGFLQVLADVFNSPVVRLHTHANSAALGGAFRALQGLQCANHCTFVPLDVTDALQFGQIIHPQSTDVVAMYQDTMLPRFAALEIRLREQLQ